MIFFDYLLRVMLFPFSLLYALIIGVRNLLYDNDFLKSASFDIPMIAIGNLSVGGTGKTPHIEYLIRLLSPHYRIAVLSRGYKRKTKGYRLIQPADDAMLAGDEPMLLKRKYPFAEVCVAENRMLAIPQLLGERPQTQIILLDDAFQHRSVKPSLSVLLTTFSHPYFNDFLLPAGRLREFPSAAARADFMVVTKCPPDLSAQQRKDFLEKIKPTKHQKVFFSYFSYGAVYNLMNPAEKMVLNKNMDVYIFCGIASTDELENYLQSTTRNYWLRDFADHHYYDRYDLENIATAFGSIESDNKILLTTEKDAARLFEHREWFVQKKLTIFALPVETQFFEEDKMIFEQEIMSYLGVVVKKESAG
jgi:tetraacyldisaccharide 4'-kinase